MAILSLRKHKRPKVALINVHDYPRDKYSVYWEIFREGSDVDESGVGGWVWNVRFYDYHTNRIVEHGSGAANTLEESDRAAQKWVLANIEKYRTAPRASWFDRMIRGQN